MVKRTCAADFLHSVSYIQSRLWLWSTPECQQILDNVTLALQNRNASLVGDEFRMLLIGDSTDRQLLSSLCETFRSRMANFTNGPREMIKQNGVFCQFGSGSVVGQFHNFGVEEPPYWHVWKSHMASGVSNHSFERIRKDCTGFRGVARGDPSLVMVRSAS